MNKTTLLGNFACLRKAYLFAFSLLFLNACLLTNEDKQNEKDNSCNETTSESCSYTEEINDGNKKKKAVFWEVDSAIYWQLFYNDQNELIPEASFKHYFDENDKDFKVIWFKGEQQAPLANDSLKALAFAISPTNEKDTLWIAGWEIREYDSKGTINNRTVFHPSGMTLSEWTLKQSNTNKPCSPESMIACADTTFNVEDYSNGADTLALIRKWNPETREYLEVTKSIAYDYVSEESSFMHIYNANFQDSILYWVRHLDSLDKVYYKGYTLNFYEDNRLTHLYQVEYVFEDEEDEQLFAYKKFNSKGDVIEEMLDAYVEQFDDQSRMIKSYSLGESYNGYDVKFGENDLFDTTLINYDAQGRAKTRIYKSQDTVKQTTTWFYFGETDKRQKVEVLGENKELEQTFYSPEGKRTEEKYFNSQAVLLEHRIKNQSGRDSSILLYDETGALKESMKFIYWPDSYYLKMKTFKNSQGNVTKIFEHNEQGFIIKEIDNTGKEITCKVPFSRINCTPAE